MQKHIIAAIMYPSLIFHSDIYRGGLQFRKISTMALKYFDALPCFPHDMHDTLSRNCKYISFNPNVFCLNVEKNMALHLYKFLNPLYQKDDMSQVLLKLAQ